MKGLNHFLSVYEAVAQSNPGRYLGKYELNYNITINQYAKSLTNLLWGDYPCEKHKFKDTLLIAKNMSESELMLMQKANLDLMYPGHQGILKDNGEFEDFNVVMDRVIEFRRISNLYGPIYFTSRCSSDKL